MEISKVLNADQDNIRWYILEKREILLVSMNNYRARKLNNMVDLSTKNVIFECIFYLFDNLKSLQNTMVFNIKNNEKNKIISYDEAEELLFELDLNKIKFTHDVLIKLYYFVLEGCRVCGVADSGFEQKNTNLNSSKLARRFNNTGDD